jgi:hypothetical protein
MGIETAKIKSGSFVESSLEADAFLRQLEDQERVARKIAKSTSQHIYDAEGRVIVSKKAAELRSSRSDIEEQYTYDNAGHLVEFKEFAQHGDFGSSYITRNVYEGDRLKTAIRVRVHEGKEQPNHTTHYLRQGELYENRPTPEDIIVFEDDKGNVLWERRFDIDSVNTIEYDERGRMMKKVSSSDGKKRSEEVRVFEDSADGSYSATVSKIRYDQDGRSTKRETWIEEYNTDGLLVSRKNQEDPDRFELLKYDKNGKIVQSISRDDHSAWGMKSDKITTRFTRNTYDDHGNELSSETREAE